MAWLFVGILAGSLVSSSHETKEACEGRAVTLRDKGVIGQCVQPAPVSICTGQNCWSPSITIR